MATAWTPLANVTLGANAATVTFSSISQSYRDLVLVATVRGTAAQTEDYAYLRFNGDAGANYSRIEMNGNGSTASAAQFSNLIPITMVAANGTANSYGLNKMDIFDYSASDKYKIVSYRLNPETITDLGLGRWSNTAAITSLSCVAYTGSFAAGSSFALYGIAA